MNDQPLRDIGEDPSLLLVDDDEPFLRRLARAMEKRGWFRSRGKGKGKGNGKGKGKGKRTGWSQKVGEARCGNCGEKGHPGPQGSKSFIPYDKKALFPVRQDGA